MAAINWTDTFGNAELRNIAAAPGDGFLGWKPLTPGKGARVTATALGTGITFGWNHRRNFGASFTLAHIAYANQDLVARLKDHLEGGGLISVNTGDSNSAVYQCYIWPESEVQITGPDKTDRQFSISLAVINLTADEIMTCVYP